MAGATPLSAWLYDMDVARIHEAPTGKLTLQYTGHALQQWRTNVPVLSVSMPLQAERYPPGIATPYLEGLLPEGEARTSLEQNFGVRRGGTYGLLAAIGRDCAGAIMVCHETEPPPTGRRGSVQWIDSKTLSTALADLPAHPLGASHDVRVSLAGMQSKLLLVQGSAGTWGIPRGGHPSTHILKPEDARYPAMVANEAFCLRLALAVGLTTVEPATLVIDGRPVLVVPRYDRVIDEDGHIRRLHQEDICQALAIDTSRPDAKYEAHGGPTLGQVAGILDRFNGGIEQLDRLLQVVTLTVAVGNADAHGKNLSLIHRRDGTVELAPLYDVLSTIQYPNVTTPDGARPVSTDLAMRVGGQRSLHHVTVDDLVEEATTWPYARRRALQQVSSILGLLPRAVETAARATEDLPSEIPERILRRIETLRGGRAADGSCNS
jgi:serine/threonine-protein kinase HipA